MDRRLDLRRAAAEIQRAALLSADPAEAIRRHVRRVTDWLLVGDVQYHLPDIERVFVVALGKAAAAMTDAFADLIDDQIAGGIVVTQSLSTLHSALPTIIAGRPTPNENSVLAGQQIAALLADAKENDLVVCLIGGGSSLATLPVEGVSLADLQSLTDALLRSGATINELNTVRKHLDRIKRGGIARMAGAQQARVLSLILSDVVGDPLDMIASGPTSPDTTLLADAWQVIELHGLADSIPTAIREYLQAGMHGDVNTAYTQPGDALFDRVQNVIVGSNRQAAQAAVTRAGQLGFNSLLLSTFVEGEARQVARVAAALAKEIVRYGQPVKKPACLVWGGETTVTVLGRGKGGRNQELALAAAIALDGWPNVLVEALGTDGADGSTDAAGAIATGETVSRARAAGLDAQAMLADNDAYNLFAPLGDLVVTGPTGTNVNDLLFILISDVE